MAAGAQMEMSKTYQYRKVMKPMLERKRRARINKCLDELKDLMVATLESEGEHVTRLEKADILELTVTHLQKLRERRKLHNGSNGVLSQAEGFRTGYIYAANEVSTTLAQIPGISVSLGSQLMTHLSQRLNQIQPPTIKIPTPVLPYNTSSLSSSSSVISSSYSPTSALSSSPSSSSSSLSSSTSVAAPLSPMSSRSSFTESPQPYSDNNYNKHTEIIMTIGLNRCNRDNQEDNVWRPW